MAVTTKVSAKLSFAKDDAKWSKTFSGLDPEMVTSTNDVRNFAKSYVKIVDGELTGADYIVTTPVNVN